MRVTIFLIALFLLFYHLDNGYLWQDEAETACLAKNILKFGVPKAYDGKNTILLSDSSNNPENYLPGKLWRGCPWLSIYAASLSLKVFGLNTFAARFPFALFGLFSIFLIYLVVKRLFGSNIISSITVLLAVFSVPLILHSRQCRYYSLGIFLTAASIYFYLDYLDKKRFSGYNLLTALFLLINTSVSYYLSVITGIALHLYFIEKKDLVSRRKITFFLIAIAYTIPILYLLNLSRRSVLDLHWVLHNIRYYVKSINSVIFPWKVFLIFYFLFVVTKKRLTFHIPESDKKSVFLLLVFILSPFPYLIFADFNSLRYVIHIAPLFFILEAYIFYRMIKASRIMTACLVSAAIFTNLLNLSLPVQSYFFKYIYEITHDYKGPIEGIVGFLNKNSKPGDTVKITYGDNACIFYTDLKIDNTPPFDNRTYPEWIIPRRHWNQKDFYNSPYSREVKKRYEEIVIPYPDIAWENRPDDMGYHRFKTDAGAPEVTIYKRL